MKLITLGNKSLKNDFIFALKKIYREDNKFNSFVNINFNLVSCILCILWCLAWIQYRI